ncbi:hypothetical protein GCM10011418_44710 [Sphingobacterium alkalisoli]|nr:hypothetical protein GCM10011418_44710 [Sphingobacterium alkalisoli]
MQDEAEATIINPSATFAKFDSNLFILLLIFSLNSKPTIKKSKNHFSVFKSRKIMVLLTYFKTSKA